MSVRVTVGIVLHDSAADIVACLAALSAQTRPADAVVVLDNASSDDGLGRARQAMPEARLERSGANIGFAAGHNRAMALEPADIHVVLNPDCRLAPRFLEHAIEAIEADPTIGAVSGRLLRFRDDASDGGSLIEQPGDILDSTGMVALRNRRVLDRSSDLPAAGRDLAPADVFGASGAAAVYRRTMLEDVAFEGEWLDESFFAYREDVDLAWRAQLLGWRCRYLPTALARHRRRVAPGRRGALPARINRLSVANRWRMIAKNELAAGWRRDWRSIVGRDVQILGYCALREQPSLLAVADVAGDAVRLRAWRRDLMRRRRAADEDILGWFGGRAERAAP
ncbi:MAG TPA: glycosyltransferase family 2 protein [Candidatus Limnocylindrales bacterium]|nr:glycosyltransferase family 2 protein [Candidatus Limnocylindrales bacterium]